MARQAFISCFLFSVIFSVGCAQEYIATGTSYTFKPPQGVKGPFQSIDWRKGKGLVVVDWDPGNGIKWYKYGEQADLDNNTGYLTIHQMKKEDSGEFNGHFMVGGAQTSISYTITVIGLISRVNVNCTTSETGTTLLCYVDHLVDADFSWTGPNGFTHSGDSVFIPGPKTDSVYFCTASNKLGTMTTEFNHNNCPGDINITAIVITIIVIVIFMAVAAGVFYREKIKQVWVSCRGGGGGGKPGETHPMVPGQNPSEPNTSGESAKISDNHTYVNADDLSKPEDQGE